VPINYVRGMLEDLQKAMSLDELRANLASPRSDVFKSSGFSHRLEVPYLWRRPTLCGLTGISSMSKPRRLKDSATLNSTVANSRKLKTVATAASAGAPSHAAIVGGLGPGTTAAVSKNNIELNSVTPSRIEGRIFAPANDAVFDCGRCSYSKRSVWKPFVWIPQ